MEQDIASLPRSGSVAVPEGRVFHTLDALRGIAAIGVVAFHMGGAFSPIEVPGGYLAVDLFFMMSGVVLSHAYEDRFRAGMGTLGFMRVRLVRLYPLYFLGTLFGIAVTLASLLGRNSRNWDGSSLLEAASLAVLFLPSLASKPVDQMFPLNIPCWSLFFEILVNLLFVICWPLLTSRRLVTVAVLTGTAVGMAAVYHGNLDQGSSAADFLVGLARTVFGFSVGVLIARHVRETRRSRSNLKVLAIVTVFALAIAARPADQWRAVWDAVSVLAVFPLLVYCGTLIDPRERLQRVATFLGVTSYAIYVLHSPLSSVWNSFARQFAGDSGPGLAAPWSGVSVLAVLLAGCWLIDRFFDMPVRRWLNRKLRAPRAN